MADETSTSRDVIRGIIREFYGLAEGAFSPEATELSERIDQALFGQGARKWPAGWRVDVIESSPADQEARPRRHLELAEESLALQRQAVERQIATNDAHAAGVARQVASSERTAAALEAIAALLRTPTKEGDAHV